MVGLVEMVLNGIVLHVERPVLIELGAMKNCNCKSVVVSKVRQCLTPFGKVLTPSKIVFSSLLFVISFIKFKICYITQLQIAQVARENIVLFVEQTVKRTVMSVN